MKTHAEYTEDVPNWSLPYLINGDASGLENDEQSMVDSWMAEFRAEAEKVGGHVVYSPTEETDDFCRCPAFGLACDTTKTEILILV